LQTGDFARETLLHTDPYADSREYLLDELKRLEVLVRIRLSNEKLPEKSDTLYSLKGLVLSRGDIDELLNNPHQSDRRNRPQDEEARMPEDYLSQLVRQIDARKRCSLNDGIYLSLPHLASLFHLTSFEQQCILISLAPEIDTRFEKCYAYLQDDITRKRPTIDLILMLLCATQHEKLSSLAVFTSSSPLFRFRLMQFIDDQAGTLPLISRPLAIDKGIVHFLVGIGQIDERLDRIACLVPPFHVQEEITLPMEKQQALRQYLHRHFHEKGTDRKNILLHFSGPTGSGKESLMRNICADLGIPLLIADAERMLSSQISFEDLIWFLGRETILQQSALCLKNYDALLEANGSRDRIKMLFEVILIFSPLTFLLGRGIWQPNDPATQSVIFASFRFPIPHEEERTRYWESMMKKYTVENSLDTAAFAAKFRFTPGRIRDALAVAETRALMRSPGCRNTISAKDLLSACRELSHLKLGGLARKIVPRCELKDIVLPMLQKSQLREICNFVRYRGIVYGTWGFGKKLSMGKGLNVLFAGPSGTGKTMAAEIIAHELGLDLYRIDLSQVVSKYIGETEKNLASIFDEAQTSNAILFFDEADALFGKRSEVKDAHDRYANIEIGYLLQKMEEYDGVAILATNLRQNMDEAFVRRMQFIVDFPFPDERHRELIWRTIFPESTPLSKDLDYQFLAEKLKLAGGNIKNIALTSAFYAAEETTPAIGMGHIMLATKREYQKIGKSFLKTDFEPYYDLIGER
jgi:AAA+ superfamily predicted ATPase